MNKKGGKIYKSALYKLHKGEVVVPAYKVKIVDKILKQAGNKQCKNCILTDKQLKQRKVKQQTKSKKPKKFTYPKMKKQPTSLFNFFR